MIEILISDSVFGTKRKVVFEGIDLMSQRNKTAVIKWVLTHYDQNDKRIDNIDLIQDRIIETPISDENRVKKNGDLIDRIDYETDEEYQQAFDAGYPEYSFWWSLISQHPLPIILNQAAQILNNHNRFNRI